MSVSEIAILRKEGLEFKSDAAGTDSLGIYTSNSVKYNNVSVFNFNADGLNFDKKVTSTATPEAFDDLVTKKYVDEVAVGLNVIQSCEVATVENINIGSWLQNQATINGVLLVDGSRVLVWKQNVKSENGIYVVAGETAHRSSDFDESTEIKGGVHTFVTGGDLFADCGFVVTSPDGDLMTVGTTDIEWAQFSKAGVHTFDGSSGLATGTDGLTVSIDDSIARVVDVDALANTIRGEITNSGATLAAKVDPALDDGAGANRMVFVNEEGTALASLDGFAYNFSGITVPNVTTTSDETKKRDIKELSDSDLIYKLRPVEYKWKDENMDQRTKYGFIAQEVLEIFPSMVTKQNGVYGIEYINLISHLVKEVQILREEVNSMKN